MIKQNFPHPVLDPVAGDYPNCGIQFMATMLASPSAYQFDVEFEIGSDTLLEAIEEKKAAFAVQVNCKWTAFRQVIKFSEPNHRFEIREEKLRNDVLLRPFVVAIEDFELQSDEFNPMFDGLSFPLRKGAVLAWDNPLEFDATKSIDDLKNINSVLQIIKKRDYSGPVIYGLESEKIQIYLPEKDYAAFSIAKGYTQYRNALMCMLALPALSYAIHELDKDENKTRWARVISARIDELRNKGITEEDPWKLAQLLLDFPVSKAMESIVSFEEISSL